MASGWTTALLGATALHAGFQATVTLLVYPALGRVPASDWSRDHEAHTRSITPLVAVVYGAVVVCCTGAVVSVLRGTTSAGPAVWIAVAATAGVLAVTAALAAPTHGRLGHGRDEALVHRLLVVDRLRLAGSLLALAAAVCAIVTA